MENHGNARVDDLVPPIKLPGCGCWSLGCDPCQRHAVAIIDHVFEPAVIDL